MLTIFQLSHTNILIMKATQLILTLVLLASLPFASKAQEKPKFQYTVGFGPSIDQSIHLYGMNLTNELTVSLGKRTSFNAGVSFYQSLGSFKDESWEQGLQQKTKNGPLVFLLIHRSNSTLSSVPPDSI
jgi:hypothetical protein